MKKINLLLIGLLISISAIGQDIKIGYTNVEYILSFLPETKQVQSEVQAYGTQLQNQLQSKITDFQSKADVFQKTAATMTDLIRADKQEELQKKSDKIMKELDKDFKDYDLSKAESNENSKVDMSNNEQTEIEFTEE